jgi:hypothetical protein
MKIGGGIGVEEEISAMVSGVAAASFLHAKRCFDVNFLIRVIEVKVVDPRNEIPQARRIRKMHLDTGLAVGSFRKDVVMRVYSLKQSAATA